MFEIYSKKEFLPYFILLTVEFQVEIIIICWLATVDFVYTFAYSRFLIEDGPAQTQEFDVDDFFLKIEKLGVLNCKVFQIYSFDIELNYLRIVCSMNSISAMYLMVQFKVDIILYITCNLYMNRYYIIN